MGPAPHSSIPSPSPAPSETQPYPFGFHGSGEELFGIFIINVFLTIVTLGIYSFWAKVRTRQYLWGQTEFAGDRFGYHATGKELLMGWIKAAVLFGGIVVLSIVLSVSVHDVLGTLVLWAGLLCLVPLAYIGTMRYRLSRTSWRGIRFSFRGQIRPFFWLSVRGMVLTALTLSLYYPFYECEVRRFMVDHSNFGSGAFAFDGKPEKLFRVFVAHWFAALIGFIATFFILTQLRDLAGTEVRTTAVMIGALFPLSLLIVLSLVWVSYAVRRRRYYWEHTSFADARFATTVSIGNLLRLYAVNLLLIVVTLGLALPWVTVRTRHYDCEHLTLRGSLDLDQIAQQARTATAVGEELGGFLDVDALPG